MNNFFDSELCRRGDACRKCRRSKEYRNGIVAVFDEPTDVEFECPRGKTSKDFPQDIEPNIFQMGVNLARSMTSEAKARLRNDKSLSPEERQERLDVCAGCQFFVNNKRCSKCGCFVGFKSRLRSGTCPIGKWRIVDKEESP